MIMYQKTPRTAGSVQVKQTIFNINVGAFGVDNAQIACCVGDLRL